MKVLVLDSSTPCLSLGIFDGQNLLCQSHEIGEGRHSDTLAISLEKLLSENQISWKALDAVAVGTGPGSFTGLRIGVTTAKTLAYALSIKLWSVSSLEAMAFGAPVKEGTIVPLLDARRGEVYSAIYEKTKKGIKTLLKPGLFSAQVLLKKIKNEAFFVGEAAFLYQEAILNKKGILPRDKKELENYPTARGLFLAAWPKIKKNKSEDIFKLEPFYIHPRDCNVMRKNKK